MMTAKTAQLTVQKWGNSLAVRIPAAIARRAHFNSGTQVELIAQYDGIIIKFIGERKLSLDERLDIFDPQKHGGEAMAAKPIGVEKF